MTKPVRCPVCKAGVTCNTRGELLIHTRLVGHGRNGTPIAEVCPGSRKGARP